MSAVAAVQEQTLLSVSDGLASVTEAFARGRALGCLYVDGSALEEVETLYGHEAYLRALRGLGVLVGQVSQELQPGQGTVLKRGMGRSEIVLLRPSCRWGSATRSAIRASARSRRFAGPSTKRVRTPCCITGCRVASAAGSCST